jgi:hypothetical protein
MHIKQLSKDAYALVTLSLLAVARPMMIFMCGGKHQKYIIS